MSQPQSRIMLLPEGVAASAAARVEVPEALARLNIFRLLLRHERLAKSVSDVLLTLLSGTHLPHRLRELVIMRLGWTTGSAYEWTQHWRIAQDLGLAAEELLAVREWPDAAAFGPAEQAVLRAVDDVVAHGAITGATWRECRTHIGDDDALLELVAAVGAWQFVSVMLRSAEVPLEAGVAEWPPDGRSPG
jgi:alkylhydroperoxidase family enzyme